MFLKFAAFLTTFVFCWNSTGFGQIPLRSFVSVQQPIEIIHIQDAHANPACQRNICELIEHFRKEDGIDLVFVEGAATQLDRKYLQFDRNPKINQKVTNELARMGELSGADLYLLKERSQPVEFVGLEDIALYRRNLDLFRKVMSREEESRKWIVSERRRLEREASRLNNKELLSLLRLYLNLNMSKKTVLFLDQLSKKFLNRDFREANEQIDFPNLVRLLRLMDDEGKIDLDAAKKELSVIQSFLPSRKGVVIPAKAGIQVFLNEGDHNPRFLLEQMYAELAPQGFDFAKYPHFSRLAKNRVYQYELKSEGLFKELQNVISILFSALAKSKEEKAMVQEVRSFILTSKLITLELTREEWSAIARSAGSATWQSRQDAIAFYQAAILREKTFIARIEKVLKDKKKSRALVITGGFHTEGLAHEFDMLGIDHTLITPEAKGDSRRNYVNALLGKYPSSAETSEVAGVDEALPSQERESLGANIIAFQSFVVGLNKAASLGAKKEESPMEKLKREMFGEKKPKKGESEQEKLERSERVIEKMSEMLQVDKGKIVKILDDGKKLKTSVRIESDQAGWIELLEWAFSILSDLDIADAKYIDVWKKYNRRINNLEKRPLPSKEKNAKYKEVEGKKRLEKAKNKKLHALAGQLIANLKDFIDDEIAKTPGRKGLLRSIQIAPVQKARRSIGKALRSINGEEAQRTFRETKFGVVLLSIKSAEQFIEEQTGLFDKFQQLHSPKSSASRRHQKIEHSSVSELDVVDQEGRPVVSDDFLDPVVRANRKKGKGKSLGLKELSEATGIPVVLIERFSTVSVEKIDRKDPHAGTALLVQQVIKIDAHVNAIDQLLAQLQDKFPKKKGFSLHLVIDASLESFRMKFVEDIGKLERQAQEIHGDAEKFFRELKRFWKKERALAGFNAIVEKSKKDSFGSAVTRIIQHVPREGRQALSDTIQEEGFLSWDEAQGFLDGESKILDPLNQKLNSFRSSAVSMQEAAMSGKSLGLAQLGHNVEGMHRVNRLMEGLLYPEDEQVLGKNRFEREVRLGDFWFRDETLLKAMESLTEKREGEKPFVNAA